MTILDRASETEYQRLVIDYARLKGWRVAHFRPAQMRSGAWATPMQGDPGFPDLVLARKGQVVFAELKSEKGRVTQEQKDWLTELTNLVHWTTHQTVSPRDNPEGYVWRPSDWPEVMEILA